MAETKIYAISQTIDSNRIREIKNYHDAMESRTPFAGLCLAPQRDSTGNTTGLILISTGYKADETSGLNRLSMVTHPTLMSVVPASSRSATAANVAVPNRSVFEINFTTLREVSLWSRILDYDRTREFDFAFIDSAILDYMMVEVGFYRTGTDISTRGIQIERALTIFSTERERSLSNFFSITESGVYRSLKITPYPTPNLASDYDSRSSTAYAIIPTCPPFWRGSTSTSSGVEAMARSIEANSEVLNSLGGACSCALFSINRQDLVQKLIQMNVIPADKRPLYRIKKWPFILLALLIATLSVLGSREIYGLVFGK
jgi:hypothetical protein